MDELLSVVIMVAAFVLGLTLGVVAAKNGIYNDAGYQECISELPRNQDCKLIAVPVEENNK